MFKQIFQKFLNIFGYKVSKNKENKFKNFDLIIKKILKRKKVNIIDIGANKGQTIERFKELFNDAKIYAFEPTKNLAEKLNIIYKKDKNIKIFNKAVGDKNGKTIFFNYSNNELNSLYKIRDPNFKRNSKTKCEMITLDKFCLDNTLEKIDILKIDTQGNEKRILEGAKKSLQKGVFEIIELEIILGDYYDIKNSFLDIEKNLIKNNYRLLAIDRLINFFSNKYMYFNAIYIKQSLYKKLNNNS